MKKRKHDEQLQIILDVCHHILGFKIDVKGRKPHEVTGRMIFYNVALNLTKHSLTMIGQYVFRDHATVLHSEKNFERDVLKEEKWAIAHQDILHACSEVLKVEVQKTNDKDIHIIILEKKLKETETDNELLKHELKQTIKNSDSREMKLINLFRSLDFETQQDAIFKITTLKKVREKLNRQTA